MLQDIQVLNEKETRGGFGEGILEAGRRIYSPMRYFLHLSLEYLCPETPQSLYCRSLHLPATYMCGHYLDSGDRGDTNMGENLSQPPYF